MILYLSLNLASSINM